MHAASEGRLGRRSGVAGSGSTGPAAPSISDEMFNRAMEKSASFPVVTCLLIAIGFGITMTAADGLIGTIGLAIMGVGFFIATRNSY